MAASQTAIEIRQLFTLPEFEEVLALQAAEVPKAFRRAGVEDVLQNLAALSAQAPERRALCAGTGPPAAARRLNRPACPRNRPQKFQADFV